MVFVLRHVAKGDILVLGHNMKYTLGRSRKNNIHLPDISVDKLHATLEISEDDAKIQDMDTEFGTRVNNRKIREPFKLCNGDVILFGKDTYCKYVFLNANFEVQLDNQIPECTTTSLKNTLEYLKINVAKNYHPSCSHYVIEKVTLDTLEEKTIFKYLIDRKTVITPKYFEDLLTNIKEAPLIPNLYRYMPEIDQYLVSKGVGDIPRNRRRFLFENITFVFFNAACEEKLSSLIFRCGGDTIMYTQDEEFMKCLDCGMIMYIAVNHNSNGKKTPLMKSFSRTMKQQKKKVFKTFCVIDVYISILKGSLDNNSYEKSRINNGDNTAPTAGISEDSKNNLECDLKPIHSSSPKKQQDSHQMPAIKKDNSNLVETVLPDKDGWITRVKKSDCQNISSSSADTSKTNGSRNLDNGRKNNNLLTREGNGKSSLKKESQKTSTINANNASVIIIDDDEEEIKINLTNQTTTTSRKNGKSGSENNPCPNKRTRLVINPFSQQANSQRLFKNEKSISCKTQV